MPRKKVSIAKTTVSVSRCILFIIITLCIFFGRMYIKHALPVLFYVLLYKNVQNHAYKEQLKEKFMQYFA